MQTNAQKSQKTSCDLGSLYVNDWKNREIETDTLYLVSR